jgi:hypothetical protein
MHTERIKDLDNGELERNLGISHYISNKGVGKPFVELHEE